MHAEKSFFLKLTKVFTDNQEDLISTEILLPYAASLKWPYTKAI